MGVRENLERVLERIEKAKERAGRKDQVKLIAVTKTFPMETIKEAIEFGVKDFGENYVQEALSKWGGIEGVTLHMIGHLQRNKAKKALKLFHVIQTIDSVRLAEELNKRAQNPVKVMIEVNIGRESSKSGISPEECLDLAEKMNDFGKLDLIGLMTVPPITDDEKELRGYFRSMVKLLNAINERKLYKRQLRELSMGMTNDFEIAIEEGATMVRVGRAIFGERAKKPIQD